MPSHAGPNPALDSNIVFSYDTGDTSNSYRGEPTTNYQMDWGPWTVGGINTDVTNTVDQGPVKGAKTWKFEKTGTSNQWNGWESSYGGIWTGNAGDIWTTSYWYKAATDAGLGGFQVGAFYKSDWSAPYNCTVLANQNSIIADGQWHYNYTTTQFNENYSNAIIVDGPSWGYSGNSGVLYVNGLQWEKKPHPTPFVYGTRSATQGLLPLISNTSLNISTVSFDSNAQMVFDGTDDYINAGSIQPFTLSSRTATWETVVKFGTSSGAHAIATKWNNSTGQIWWFGRYPTTKIHIAMIINGNYYAYYSDGDLSSTSNYYHIVVTLNDTILSYYINGVLDSTDTVAAGTWATDNGNPDLIIGAQNAGTAANFNGSIPILKMYNTSLSADQVKQNYQQYKTRFNLS